MPKLPTFTADLGGSVISGGRQASVADANVADFSPVNSAIQRSGTKIIDMLGENEARTFMVKQAEIKAEYAQRLDAAVTSGEDLGKIKDEMNADLSKVTEGFQTRQGSDTAAYGIANTNAIFDSEINRIQVVRAKATAQLDTAKFLKDTEATVTTSPSALPMAEKDIEAFMSTYKGRVSPEWIAARTAELKQGANYTAAIANAKLLPTETKAALESGAYDLTGPQRLQAIAKAEQTIKAKITDAHNERIMAKQAAQDLSEGLRKDYFTGIVKGTVKLTDVINDPRLVDQDLEALTHFADAWSKRGNAPERSDPRTRRDLWMKIAGGQAFNGNEVLDAVAKRKLSTVDGDHLLSMVGGLKDENNRTITSRLYSQMRIIGDTLATNPKYEYRPGMVAAIQMEFQTRAMERVSELRKNNEDPSVVFDRSNKNWIGNPAFVQSAIDSAEPQQQQASVADAAAREPVKFPDGVTRVWTGRGDRKDLKNWVPATQESPLVSQIPK